MLLLVSSSIHTRHIWLANVIGGLPSSCITDKDGTLVFVWKALVLGRNVLLGFLHSLCVLGSSRGRHNAKQELTVK